MMVPSTLVLVPRRVLFIGAALLVLAPLAVAGERCVPVGDLSPGAEDGVLARLGTEDDGRLWKWSADAGGTLQLRLRSERPGAHELSVRVQHGRGSLPFTARAWGAPLTRAASTTNEGLREIRFEPIPLGPGYQLVELEAQAEGSLILDCVRLRRTGASAARLQVPAPAEDEPAEDRAFLGVQLGDPDPEGVRVARAYDGTAAGRMGIREGDVIVSLGGARTGTLAALQSEIRSRRPGDAVDVVLLRDGERLVKRGELGSRPPERELRTGQARDVIEALGVRPGHSVADIGCGSGWLSEAIATEVGREGTVYAVEIQEDHVRSLHARGIPRVIPVLSAPDDVSLPADSLDIAMLHDVASHIDRDARPAFYASVRRALRPRGRLVVFGPHGGARSMLEDLEAHGFVPVDPEGLQGLSASQLDDRLAAGIAFRPVPRA